MTASRYDLLPPNATQLERDFSRAINPLPALGPLIERPILTEDGNLLAAENERLILRESSAPFKKPGGAVSTIRTAKRTNIPDGVVPWLIYEYGLGEILPYLGNNQRRAIAEGVLWQRIRGTADAVRIALSWVGVTGLVEESESGTYRWAEYQLGLSAGTTGDQIISDIVGVTRISSPVRSRLQRIYAVYDFRRFVLDNSLLSDGGMLSDHSGVRPQPDWPQISYGQIHSSLVLENITVASGHTDVVGVLAEMSDRFILSRNKLDEDWHTVNHPALLTTQEGLSAAYSGQVWGPFTWGPRVFATDEVVMGREDGTALWREDGLVITQEEYPPAYEGWADVNVVVSSSVVEEANPAAVFYVPALRAIVVDSSQVWLAFTSVFCREDGGVILSEDNRAMAREEYLT